MKDSLKLSDTDTKAMWDFTIDMLEHENPNARALNINEQLRLAAPYFGYTTGIKNLFVKGSSRIPLPERKFIAFCKKFESFPNINPKSKEEFTTWKTKIEADYQKLSQEAEFEDALAISGSYPENLKCIVEEKTLSSDENSNGKPEEANNTEGHFQTDKFNGTEFIEKGLPHILRKMPESDNHVNGAIFLDVDDLTVINKKFGNEVGDIVLEEIAAIIRRRSAFRYSGRCGDDTFYGILFRTNIEKTLEICTKIKRDISYYPWRSIADKLRVTCTIGSAMMTKDEHPYSWLERSIKGMLEGKEKGGNIIQPGPLYLSKKEIREAEAAAAEAEAAAELYRNWGRSFSLRDWFS